HRQPRKRFGTPGELDARGIRRGVALPGRWPPVIAQVRWEIRYEAQWCTDKNMRETADFASFQRTLNRSSLVPHNAACCTHRGTAVDRTRRVDVKCNSSMTPASWESR
ncbi:unnamed protein product, partial [Ectocarpus sp. 13 AM-2016]